MYNKLLKLKAIAKNEGASIEILLKIDELIKLEDKRIHEQYAKDNKCTNAYKACMKVLNYSKTRRILQKVKQYDDKSIVFTDGYQLYWLNDNRYNLPVINEETEGKYPDVSNLIQNKEKGIEIKLPTIEELKVKIAKKEFYIEFEGFVINPQFLINAYSILGKNLKAYSFGNPLKPIQLYNENDELGLILPMRGRPEAV